MKSLEEFFSRTKLLYLRNEAYDIIIIFLNIFWLTIL